MPGGRRSGRQKGLDGRDLDWGLCVRQRDRDHQSRPGVVRRDPALVNFHGAAGNGQPKAHPAAGPATVVLDPEKGLEDVREKGFRNTGAMIANGGDRHVAAELQSNLDRRPLGSMPDRVPHDVLDGAVQQLPLSGYHGGLNRPENEPASPRFRLEIAVVRDIVEQVVQRNVPPFAGCGIALDASQPGEARPRTTRFEA